jgi:hypothetical protein
VKPKVTVQSRSDTLIKEEKIVVAMLSRQTLVLNRNWQPVGVASVARSLTLVAAERARIVDPTDFQQTDKGDRYIFDERCTCPL